MKTIFFLPIYKTVQILKFNEFFLISKKYFALKERISWTPKAFIHTWKYNFYQTWFRKLDNLFTFYLHLEGIALRLFATMVVVSNYLYLHNIRTHKSWYKFLIFYTYRLIYFSEIHTLLHVVQRTTWMRSGNPHNVCAIMDE